MPPFFTSQNTLDIISSLEGLQGKDVTMDLLVVSMGSILSAAALWSHLFGQML